MKPGILRRFLGLVVFGPVLMAQVLFVFELLGFHLSPVVGVPLVFGAAPLLAVALLRRRAPEAVLPTPIAVRWFGVGLAFLVIWAGLYYFTAAVVDPNRAVALPRPLLDRFEVQTTWALIYVGVQLTTFLPYLWVADPLRLRRLLWAHLTTLAVCVVVWWLYPVSLARSATLDPSTLGGWTLSLVWSKDPPVNCLPSSHCAMVCISALAMRGRGWFLATWSAGTAVAISVSTVMTHQHYSMDVLTGVVLGVGAWWFAGRLLGAQPAGRDPVPDPG